MAALARGFWHAHMGWIFDRDMSNQQRFAPDLLADKDIVRANKYFWVWTIVSVVGPAVIGGLITMSWARFHVLGRCADDVLRGQVEI